MSEKLKFGSLHVMKVRGVAVTGEVEVRGKKYIIRNYVPSDMKEVLDLSRDLYDREINPITGLHINEELLATMERSANLVTDLLVVECEAVVCGFLRYVVWENCFSGEVITENISMYIRPECRSKMLFSSIVSALESIAFHNGSGVITISFETPGKKYAKRRLMEGMGFCSAGVFLCKKPKIYPEVSPEVSASLFRLPGVLWFVKKNMFKNGWLSFCKWVLLELYGWFMNRKGGKIFICDGNGFIFAKTMVRGYDMQKISIVTLICFPSESLIAMLESWSYKNGCAEVRINTSFFDVDPRSLFPDYERFGYDVLGFVMRKSIYR